MSELEDWRDLNLQIENLKFNKIESISKEKIVGKVNDLLISELHNYNTEIGIAHNGGGKV